MKKKAQTRKLRLQRETLSNLTLKAVTGGRDDNDLTIKSDADCSVPKSCIVDKDGNCW